MRQDTVKSRDGVDQRCAEWWEGGESELGRATLKPGLLMVMVKGYGGERQGDQAPSLSFPWQLVFFYSDSLVRVVRRLFLPPSHLLCSVG